MGKTNAGCQQATFSGVGGARALVLEVGTGWHTPASTTVTYIMHSYVLYIHRHICSYRHTWVYRQAYIYVCIYIYLSKFKMHKSGDFPGGPVVKTLCFHGREHGFDPWSGN